MNVLTTAHEMTKESVDRLLSEMDRGDITRFKYVRDVEGTYGKPNEHGPHHVRGLRPVVLVFGVLDPHDIYTKLPRKRHELAKMIGNRITGINLKYLTIKELLSVAGPYEDGKFTGKILEHMGDATNSKDAYDRFVEAYDHYYGSDTANRLLHGGTGSYRMYVDGLVEEGGILLGMDDFLELAEHIHDSRVDGNLLFNEKYLDIDYDEVLDQKDKDIDDIKTDIEKIKDAQERKARQRDVAIEPSVLVRKVDELRLLLIKAMDKLESFLNEKELNTYRTIIGNIEDIDPGKARAAIGIIRKQVNSGVIRKAFVLPLLKVLDQLSEYDEGELIEKPEGDEEAKKLARKKQRTKPTSIKPDVSPIDIKIGPEEPEELEEGE